MTPGPASSRATCSMRLAPTCWPSAACGGLRSSCTHPLGPQHTTRSSTDGAMGHPRTLFTCPALPALGRVGWAFERKGVWLWVWWFQASRGTRRPKGRGLPQRGPQPRSAPVLSRLHIGSSTPSQSLPMGPLRKNPLMPKTFAASVFQGAGARDLFLRPHQGLLITACLIIWSWRCWTAEACLWLVCTAPPEAQKGPETCLRSQAEEKSQI